MKNKIIVGYVTQIYDDKGECQSQIFTVDGVPKEDPGAFPLLMVQPGDVEKLTDLRSELAYYEADHYDRQIAGE